jgi:alpha-ketoglutarate-dependent taurine dioxygenase
MSIVVGCALLEELRSFATKPQFVYRHHWWAGDAMLCDNGSTMHRASVFYAQLGRRHCYRMTIARGNMPR